MKINDSTNIGLPLRNLIGLIGAVVIGAWFAFGVIERLNLLETKNQLFEKDLLEASTQKPIDQEQFMLLEHLAENLEKLQENHKKITEKLFQRAREMSKQIPNKSERNNCTNFCTDVSRGKRE